MESERIVCEQIKKRHGNQRKDVLKGYNLKYIDIELMNTETEPYCDVGKMRVEDIANKYN